MLHAEHVGWLEEAIYRKGPRLACAGERKVGIQPSTPLRKNVTAGARGIVSIVQTDGDRVRQKVVRVSEKIAEPDWTTSAMRDVVPRSIQTKDLPSRSLP